MAPKLPPDPDWDLYWWDDLEGEAEDPLHLRRLQRQFEDLWLGEATHPHEDLPTDE